MQDETEGAVRTLSSRASKWAPTWHSSPITPKSLSGQPNELCHVGARFEAFDESVLTAPSVSSCIFFTILTLPSERCDQGPCYGTTRYSTNNRFSRVREYKLIHLLQLNNKWPIYYSCLPLEIGFPKFVSDGGPQFCHKWAF